MSIELLSHSRGIMVFKVLRLLPNWMTGGWLTYLFDKSVSAWLFKFCPGLIVVIIFYSIKEKTLPKWDLNLGPSYC